jgi:serine carboxypeptidase-like clade 1
MMHYSGDTDGAVPTYGTKAWIKGLLDGGVWNVTQPWKQWKTNDGVNGAQVSGYYEKYQGFDFVTIKGVGHMAPEWKRKPVSLMISAWVHNETIDLLG